MKICPKCNTTCAENQQYCPECGTLLTEGTTPAKTPVRNSQQVQKNQNNSLKDLPPWVPPVLALAGFIIGWGVSSTLGAALGFIGIVAGSDSTSTISKYFSYVVGIITIILFILVEFLS